MRARQRARWASGALGDSSSCTACTHLSHHLDVVGESLQLGLDADEGGGVLVAAVDEVADLLREVGEDEEAVPEVAHEEVHRGELEVGAEEGLVVARVGARDEKTTLAEDEGVVLADVEGRAGVADDLAEFVLVLAPVHVLLGGQVRGDFVRDDERELVALRGVPVEDELEEAPLVRGEDAVDNGGRVAAHVHEEAGEVVKRDVVLDAVHDGFDLHPVERRAVGVHRHAERLDLHDPGLLRQPNVRLEVHVPRLRVVEHVDRRQTRLHLELRALRVFVHECREKPALHALRGAEVLVHHHHLVRAEGHVLRQHDGHAVERDDLLQFVADV